MMLSDIGPLEPLPSVDIDKNRTLNHTGILDTDYTATQCGIVYYEVYSSESTISTLNIEKYTHDPYVAGRIIPIAVCNLLCVRRRMSSKPSSWQPSVRH